MSKSIYKTFVSYKSHILSDERSKKLIFQPDGRNHYVYRITNINTSKHYYGSRVTKLGPIDDLGIKYFSSSSVKSFITEQKSSLDNFKYKVIKIFNNPGDNILYESYLHQYFKVSSNDNFINKIIQTPFGWSIVGNKEIGLKMSIMKHEVIKNGKTRGQIGAEKAAQTMKNINPNTKQSYIHDKNQKAANTLKSIDPKTGETYAKGIGQKSAKTKKLINLDSGMSIDQINGLKYSKKLKNINPKTHISYAQEAGDRLNIHNREINPITGNTHNIDNARKAAQTMEKIDPKSGLSWKQLRNNKIKGEKHWRFQGYYIVHGIEYANIDEISISLNLKPSIVKSWCKSQSNYISGYSYGKSEYLQMLYNKSEIKYKSYKDIGFDFRFI